MDTSLLYATSVGFIPWNFLFWPGQIAVFVIAIIIYIYAIDMTPGNAAIAAYFTQAFATIVMVKYGTDFALRVFGRGLI